MITQNNKIINNNMKVNTQYKCCFYQMIMKLINYIAESIKYKMK